MPPCSSGSPAPRVILHATPSVAVATAIPAYSRSYGTRALAQNELRAWDAGVMRLVAEAARAASVARALKRSELRSERLETELELDGTQAEEDACAPQQKRLRDDAEREGAARAQKNTALNREMAARKQKAAVMTADHEAQRAIEAAGAKQPRAAVEVREAMWEGAQMARDEYRLQIIRFWDDLVASRMAECEAAEVAEIPLLPWPIDECMPPPPFLPFRRPWLRHRARLLSCNAHRRRLSQSKTLRRLRC